MSFSLSTALVRRGRFLLVSLLPLAAAAQSTGPWVASPSPFANAGASTSVRTLQLVEPATVWGWAQHTGAGGASSSTLAVTANDAQTWQSVSLAAKVRTGTSTYTGTETLDAWMTDDQHAWVLIQDVETAAITLRKTATGLTGFTAAPAPAYAARVRFFTPSTGIIISNAPSAGTWPLYRTTDGGATWTALPATLPRRAFDQPYGLTMRGSSLWITTALGQLLSTADAGLTWTNSAPTYGVFAVPAFRTATDGLLLTVDKLLLRTTDAGHTWQTVPATGALRREGLVAVPGSAGTYLCFDGICSGPSCPIQGSSISTDDGATWTALENSIYHTAIAAGQGPRAWASSYSQATLYRSAALLTGTTAAVAKTARLAWPNPSSGQLHFAPEAQARVVSLLDATGRTRATYMLPAQATTLELTGCAPGLYVLKCLVGNQLHTQRLVVQAP